MKIVVFSILFSPMVALVVFAAGAGAEEPPVFNVSVEKLFGVEVQDKVNMGRHALPPEQRGYNLPDLMANQLLQENPVTLVCGEAKKVPTLPKLNLRLKRTVQDHQLVIPEKKFLDSSRNLKGVEVVLELYPDNATSGTEMVDKRVTFSFFDNDGKKKFVEIGLDPRTDLEEDRVKGYGGKYFNIGSSAYRAPRGIRVGDTDDRKKWTSHGVKYLSVDDQIKLHKFISMATSMYHQCLDQKISNEIARQTVFVNNYRRKEAIRKRVIGIKNMILHPFGGGEPTSEAALK